MGANIDKYFNTTMPLGERYLLKYIFRKHPDELYLFTSIYNTDALVLEVLHKMINDLDERFQLVIKHNFGIGCDRISLKSIAIIIERSVVRTGQIKRKVCDILRYNLSTSARVESINRKHAKLKLCEIGVLRLPVRMYNAFMRNKIHTISDILEMNAYDLMYMRNFGIISANHLLAVMRSLDFNDWANSIQENLNDATKINYKQYAKLSKLKPKVSKLEPKDVRFKCTEYGSVFGSGEILPSLHSDYDGDPLSIHGNTSRKEI